MGNGPKRSRKSIDEYASILETRLSGTRTLYDELERLKGEFVEGNETLPSLDKVKNDIQEIITFKTGTTISEIKEYYEDLITKEDSIKNDVENKLNEVDEKLVELEERQQEINKFKDEVSEIKDQMGIVLAETNAKKDAEINKLQELYTSYDQEIAGLLPRATSAGLAAAYDTTSEEYSKKSNRMHYAFITTVSLLIVTGFLHSFPNIVNVVNDLPYIGAIWNADKVMSFINSVPLLHITLPLIWIAIICQSKAKTYLRLHAEYQHKSNLCKTFDGLQRAAGDRRNEALTDQLLTSMVSASADNPSIHLDKIKPKGFFSEVLDNFKSKP